MGVAKFSKPIQLASGVGIEDFHCGDEIVDTWVVKHSATARKRGTAVIYATHCGEKVAGFYTLSTHSVARADLGGGWLARNAPGQIPCVLLGMMGVDEQYQGLGLGAQLLRDAILNSIKIADLAGARALIVDPTGDEAAAFYRHFGFSDIKGTCRMALRLS